MARARAGPAGHAGVKRWSPTEREATSSCGLGLNARSTPIYTMNNRAIREHVTSLDVNTDNQTKHQGVARHCRAKYGRKSAVNNRARPAACGTEAPRRSSQQGACRHTLQRPAAAGSRGQILSADQTSSIRHGRGIRPRRPSDPIISRSKCNLSGDSRTVCSIGLA